MILTVQGHQGFQQESLQKGIASEIIRFHVIANSDSDTDQNLKMQVKEQIVKQMETVLKDSQSIDQTRKLLTAHLEELEQLAQKTVNEQGYAYPVKAEITNCYFPSKSYGDCNFPAGEYEALRITIGAAEGRNWWCVLYPNLCFIDAVHAVVPEEQKEELKEVLTEEEFASLFDWKKHDYEVKMKWFR